MNLVASMRWVSILGVLALLFLGFVACRQPIVLPEEELKTSLPLSGKWMTDCIDFGGGFVNRIYSEVSEDGVPKQALLSYSGAGCTGTYSLYDTMGNPISEPSTEFAIEPVEVEGIPDAFYVFRISPLDDPTQVSYVLFNVTDTAFHEMIGFMSAEPTWDGWLSLPDVPAFVADPSGFVPTGGGGVIHFSKVEGLP